MGSAKVRLSRDLSTAVAAQPVAQLPASHLAAGLRVSAARCLTSRLLPRYMALVAKSSQHQLGEEKWVVLPTAGSLGCLVS